MFVDGTTPTEDDLDVALALDPAQAHHYSNLAYGLLGRVVARAGPGCRTRTTSTSGSSGRSGSRGRPGTRRSRRRRATSSTSTRARSGREPETELGGVAAMGQLWSTVEDLARWATFLARGADGVLDADDDRGDVVPAGHVLPRRLGARLGARPELYNQNGKIFGGHGGAMAGHLAGVYVHRKTQIGAAALTNSGTRGNMDAVRRSRSSRRRWSSGRSRSSRGGPRSRAARRRARAPRPLVVGGERVRLLVGAGRAAGEGRRHAARARPRRRSSATATAGAPSAGRERGERLRVDGRAARLGGLPVHARAGAVHGLALARGSSASDDAARRRRRAGSPPSASTCRPS